jgi:hypothetical protein
MRCPQTATPPGNPCRTRGRAGRRRGSRCSSPPCSSCKRARHRTEDGKRVGEGRVTAHLTHAGNRARALDDAGVVVVRVDGAGGVAEIVQEVGADEAWQVEENHGSGHGAREEGDGK